MKCLKKQAVYLARIRSHLASEGIDNPPADFIKGGTPIKLTLARCERVQNNFEHHWECHIQPDWLLIWLCDLDKKEIHLIRTGTHSDLF